jgi:hypothetical protein
LFDQSWRLLEDAPGRLEQAFEATVVRARERSSHVHFDVVSDGDPLPLRPFSGGGRPRRDGLQGGPVWVDRPRLKHRAHIVDRRVGLFSGPPRLLEKGGDLLVAESLDSPSDLGQGQMLALELTDEAQTREVPEAVSRPRAGLPGRWEKLLLEVVPNGPNCKSRQIREFRDVVECV